MNKDSQNISELEQNLCVISEVSYFDSHCGFNDQHAESPHVHLTESQSVTFQFPALECSVRKCMQEGFVDVDSEAVTRSERIIRPLAMIQNL